MRVEYGSEVVDKDGKSLGTVDYVIRNSWTGEISKFIIYRQPPREDLSFSFQDILEATESRVKVGISSDELNKN
jgi:sporulation protein YlmC with PRC-barrel domain